MFPLTDLTLTVIMSEIHPFLNYLISLLAEVVFSFAICSNHRDDAYLQATVLQILIPFPGA